MRLLGAAGQDRADLSLAHFRPEHVRWAVTSGLGPWLRRCTARDPDAPSSPLWPMVHAADLTARVISAEHLDAVEEIIHACRGHAGPVTLLKGISACDQYYPEPHLRAMGDVDILVERDDVAAVESRLAHLGYRARSSYPAEFYATHHHLAPMFHPGRQVWVEIHRGLFPSSSRAGSDAVFSPDHVRAGLEPSSFRGARVNRLSAELQLTYLASHWAFGLRLESGTVGMLDVIRLLRTVTALRWERVLAALHGSISSTYVYLLLTYLDRRRLVDVDSHVLREMHGLQRSFGRVNLRALHGVIDRYVVGGRQLGRLMNARNFGIVWQALLSPGRPSRNLVHLVWNLLPSRGWLARRLASRAPAG